MSDQTPADEIRAAATTLRALATAAATSKDGKPTASWHFEENQTVSGEGWGHGMLYATDQEPERQTQIVRGPTSRPNGRGIGPRVERQHGEYIAAMDPTAGLALAAWLDWAANIARDHPWDPDYAGMPDLRWCTECQDEETSCVAAVDHALTVARAINGGGRG